MSYVPKNGQGSMLANTRKSKDTQPDWRGDFCTPDGQRFSIAGWAKKTTNGYDSLSLKVEPYQERQPAQPSAPAQTMPDEPIPF